MKKNAMLKIAAILMVAVLLTTCAISSTFAKYVTSDNGSDSARVAKWGVDVKTTVEGLFLETYDGGAVAGAKKVVAPGTSSGDFKATSVITGTPEVKVSVTVVPTVTLSGWYVGTDDFYCPLEFTINGDTIYGREYNSEDALVEKIVEKLTVSKSYDAKTDLATKNEEINIEFSWAWDYEVRDAEGVLDTTADVNDTILGDLIDDADEKNDPTVSIALVTTVTQLDA